MKAVQYSVSAFPKLDNEAQLARLREKFPFVHPRLQPYVPVLVPFTPVTVDEVQNVSDHIGSARRNLHAIAITVYECTAIGDLILFTIRQGFEELLRLRRAMVGNDAASLLADSVLYEPQLWVGRVVDPVQRSLAVAALNDLGKTIGIVDSVALTRIEPDGEVKTVAVYPFGLGRVDYHDRFPA